MRCFVYNLIRNNHLNQFDILIYYSHPYITEAEKDLIEISLGKGWFVPNAMIESLSPSELSCVLQDISPAHKRPIADDCHSDTNKNCDTNTFECDSSQDETSVEVVTATSSSRHNQSKKQKKVLSVPWKDMFTSKPFWAIFLSTIPQTYGFYTLLTELPKYLSNILHYDLNEVSLSYNVTQMKFSLFLTWHYTLKESLTLKL